MLFDSNNPLVELKIQTGLGMARPKKEIEKLRLNNYTVRLDSAENFFAKTQSERSGLSVSQWLRASALSKHPVKPKPNPVTKATYLQLIKIGTNINQIASRLNQGKYTKILDEIQKANHLLTSISKSLTNDY